MKDFARLALAAAAVGGIAAAASAQTPVPPHHPALPGNQPDYTKPGEPPQAGLAGVIGQMLGNRYEASARTAVTQCAATAQQRAAGMFHVPVESVRVTSISRVDRRRSGMRVDGFMHSWAMHQGQTRAGVRSNLSFRCNFDRRGEVVNIRVDDNRRDLR